MEPALEFSIDPLAVRAAQQRRLALRALIAIAFTALAVLGVREWLVPARQSLAWSFVASLLAVYAAVEVSALQWSRRSAPTLRLRLEDEALECWIGALCYALPYRELSVAHVRQRGGRIAALELRNREGQRIALAGFHDMQALAETLIARIAAARAQ